MRTTEPRWEGTKRPSPAMPTMASELVDPFPPTISGVAVASLIFAILGWSVLPVLGSAIGVVLGHNALRTIRRSEGAVQGRWLAIAGLWISYLALLAVAVVVALFVTGFIALSAMK